MRKASSGRRMKSAQHILGAQLMVWNGFAWLWLFMKANTLTIKGWQ